MRAMRLVAAVGALLLGAAGVSMAAVDTDGDGVSDPFDNCLLVKNATQTDSNGDDFGNACDADLNDDGVVNFADLAIMKRVFFLKDADADLNGDGVVNFADLAILKAAFFKVPGPSGLLPAVLPIFGVTKSGLTSDEARRLGAAFNVEAQHAEDGSVQFVSDQLANVPMLPAGAPGLAAAAANLPRDEGGMETSARAFDVIAIQRLVPQDERTARAAVLSSFNQAEVPLPGAGGAAMTKVSHTTLNLQSIDGSNISFSKPIDTSVRFDFSLADRPLLGPGAKVRFTYAPNGQVTGLGYATRDLAEGAMAQLTSPFDARRECAKHYPEGSKMQTPRLIYWAPGLEKNVQSIFPHWECRGKGPSNAELLPAVLPAVQDAGPTATIDASVQGARVMASVGVRGGTPPFSYSWQSLTTELSEQASSNPSVSYDVMPRAPTDTEIIAITITDANGLVGKARALLTVTPILMSRAAATPVPLSLAAVDVGGEFNVYDWNCVKQSAAGFKSIFESKGVPIQFLWASINSWERDFRQTGPPTNGDDNSYVDDVDLAWYTGHGNPGSFSFDNPSHDDGDIVPTDARWGNRDLEWMQLESCNVLQFDSGGVAIWDRWAKVFDGLHLLNGFQTLAACVDTPGGTSGHFSRYLFPRTINFGTVIPALKVRQAWAQMAYDLEPAGRQYVTMGAAAAGWVTNYDDYFWGEGPVGPDIPKLQIIGYWWLMGEV